MRDGQDARLLRSHHICDEGAPNLNQTKPQTNAAATVNCCRIGHERWRGNVGTHYEMSGRTRECKHRLACAHRLGMLNRAVVTMVTAGFSSPSCSSDWAQAGTPGFATCISWLASAGVVGLEATSAREDAIQKER